MKRNIRFAAPVMARPDARRVAGTREPAMPVGHRAEERAHAGRTGTERHDRACVGIDLQRGGRAFGHGHRRQLTGRGAERDGSNRGVRQRLANPRDQFVGAKRLA